VDFNLTPEEQAWQQQVRDFLAENFTQAVKDELSHRGEGVGPELEKYWKKFGEKGWMSLNWPKEYGGMDVSPMRRLLLNDELEAAGAPGLDLTVTSVAPMIMRYGTDKNKKDWLPKIASGEVRLALGYSEPDAGTDLASLRTTAVLDGEEWVINGTKIWNSGAHTQTHEWLAVRTDKDAPKHRGISVIIVPIDSPGIEISPLFTWSDVRTNQTFFTDVRVPKENLIGEVNMGWSYIVGALDNERAALGSVGGLRRVLNQLIEECDSTTIDGERLSERPDVRRQIAELEVETEVAQLMGLVSAAGIENGSFETIVATMHKVMTTELRTKIGNVGMSVFGVRGQLDRQDPMAPVGGSVELTYRSAPFLRFGGGTNEVLRDIIAQRGYHLPRVARG
jgi:alkylation response protein AidB-like acyl-CoA dehydrogenase